MATRRPPSSRSKAAPMNPPQQIPRSRSVMSKSGSSSHTTSTPSDDSKMLDSSTSSRPPTKSSDESETNIQVVIRCRRRSEREIQDNSPIIVSSAGAMSKEVSIETSVPISSLGVITLPPTRTYPFDLVFGPEADQAMIYHEVVSPMLEEVLQGYNCTLFAYGQTGTGKTYTMQGDLTPTPMGNPSSHAGMIPRVLFRLFHSLESSNTDYSVKISYIELYNEDLRDLLANDLPAPTGSIPPMGKDSSKQPDNGLKIFDDTSKRGVLIQGLEEVPVKDCKDALALLTKGSLRRQIAATKFNDHSSRSHSVFSVTVHIKETSSMGDDLLKVGKLNLVDLAGSENIGRSGAENKRAREAGMINQSLLTLGRVINALVDKSPHVPYRESKLTRLLQDSLGGRTKTCIIATISPARSNIEETLSTLDYALRAKSIRNKPEVNQRMTRNALLKEYIAEIERLKADLLAAREKTGRFVSEETWAQQELIRTEAEEAKKQVVVVEGQMRAVREEFEQSIALLLKREGELKETKEKLEQTEGVLGAREAELRATKMALEEEVIVREAYQETEQSLDLVTSNLRTVASQSLRDVGGLFDKLERKSSVLSTNSKAVITHGKAIASTTTALSQNLDEFLSSSSHQLSKMRSEVKQFESKELETLVSYSTRIDKQLARIQEVLASIRTKDTAESEALDTVQVALKETEETVSSGLDAWATSLKMSCETACKTAEAASLSGFEALEKVLRTLGSIVDVVVHEGQALITAERDAARVLDVLAHKAVEAECARLRDQNAILQQLAESERAMARRARNEIVQRVAGMLDEFTKEQEGRLGESVGRVVGLGEECEQAMNAYNASHASVMKGMGNRADATGELLKAKGAEGKKTRDAGLKTIGDTRTILNRELSELQTTAHTSIGKHSAQLHKQLKRMSTLCNDGFERHGRAKRARIDATDSMNSDIQSDFKSLHRTIASTSRNLESIVRKVVSESNNIDHSATTFQSNASGYLTALHDATQLLAEQGARGDSPTGSTPRKRVWEYVDKWELTKSRDDILRAWRATGLSATDSETFLAEHLPLPPEEDDVHSQTDGEDEEDGTEDEDVTQMPINPVLPALVSKPDPRAISPGAESTVSMALTTASTSIPTSKGHPRQRLKQKTKDTSNIAVDTFIPPMGTLVDSRTTNVYTTRRSRRR